MQIFEVVLYYSEFIYAAVRSRFALSFSELLLLVGFFLRKKPNKPGKSVGRYNSYICVHYSAEMYGSIPPVTIRPQAIPGTSPALRARG